MIELEITITLRSPLHVGSGTQQGTLAQKGMLKDRDGWPYIPASSFKGRWRHAVEQITKGVSLTPTVCTTHIKMCRQNPVCVVCQLFGSRWQRGQLRFVDLELIGPPAIKKLREDKSYRPQTISRAGIALNRQRQVTQDKHLYHTELLWPGIPLVFGNTIRGDITPKQAALLLAGLHLLPALGNSKGRGLGWIKVAAVIKKADGTVWTQAKLAAALKEVESL